MEVYSGEAPEGAAAVTAPRVVASPGGDSHHSRKLPTRGGRELLQEGLQTSHHLLPQSLGFGVRAAGRGQPCIKLPPSA